MPRKKKKEEDWQYSQGKALLIKDIRTGVIPASMDWELAYSLRPEFAVGVNPEEAKRLFKSRLAGARAQTGAKQKRAEEEERLMRADRLVEPAPLTNSRGEPRWHNSQAQATLKQDVANGVHRGYLPADYYKLRPEFQPFSPSTIAGHLKQEERLIKFLDQYGNRHKNY